MTTRVRARPPAMVTLYDRTTGAALERWPVDAAELLATGGYTTDPTVPASAPPPVPAPSVAEPLALETEIPAPVRRRKGA